MKIDHMKYIRIEIKKIAMVYGGTQNKEIAIKMNQYGIID